MSDINCPYCNAELEICHDDGFGYEEGILHQMECPRCDSYFVFETSIVFYYDAKKANCLNDGIHHYKVTGTYPSRYAKLRCDMCDDEQPLPKDHPYLKEI